jgi:DNA-binding transcriptional MerR regulator
MASIPDKLYFRVGEASRLVGVPSSVLRFWETEFKRINPKRTPSGQRLYRRQDIELLLRIKHLLYDRRFTIEGARLALKSDPASRDAHTTDALQEIRSELEAIRALLK